MNATQHTVTLPMADYQELLRIQHEHVDLSASCLAGTRRVLVRLCNLMDSNPVYQSQSTHSISEAIRKLAADEERLTDYAKP